MVETLMRWLRANIGLQKRIFFSGGKGEGTHCTWPLPLWGPLPFTIYLPVLSQSPIFLVFSINFILDQIDCKRVMFILYNVFDYLVKSYHTIASCPISPLQNGRSNLPLGPHHPYFLLRGGTPPILKNMKIKSSTQNLLFKWSYSYFWKSAANKSWIGSDFYTLLTGFSL